MPPKMPAEITLAGCGYRVTVAEGAVVFTEDEPVWGTVTRFAFERRAGCWYVTISGARVHHGVMVAHIEAAMREIAKVFGGNHDHARGEHQP